MESDTSYDGSTSEDSLLLKNKYKNTPKTIMISNKRSDVVEQLTSMLNGLAEQMKSISKIQQPNQMNDIPTYPTLDTSLKTSQD
eukprot:gnl/Chilomastix_caulleri/606.p1 GENE.gnl/Chilomastix_caulleri/606~~gnl/Chilomastix_caulleri/606.p1  ORF type:complete len:84 (+),score=20.57 gnl/Chilomastix_caulleri/606:44-295(+)